MPIDRIPKPDAWWELSLFFFCQDLNQVSCAIKEAGSMHAVLHGQEPATAHSCICIHDRWDISFQRTDSGATSIEQWTNFSCSTYRLTINKDMAILIQQHHSNNVFGISVLTTLDPNLCWPEDSLHRWAISSPVHTHIGRQEVEEGGELRAHT